MSDTFINPETGREVRPVIWNICRTYDCENPPYLVVTWPRGAEKGMKIPFCQECWEVNPPEEWEPWKPLNTEADFWKELNL